MKKSILLIVALGLLMLNGNAQPCTLGNPGVKLNFTTQNGSDCNIGLDLYFDLKHNPGGKWFWVHIWPTAAYSNWNYASPPTMSNGGLAGSIATFGVEHQGTNLVVQTSYPPDNTAPGFQSAGLIITEGVGIMADAERYTVKNLVLTVPGGCNVPQSFTADVWESQSALSQNVHCFVKGMNFFANDPVASGLLICSVPRTYTFNIRTINPGGMTVDYKVYIDDGDGIFNNTTDNIMVNSGTVTLDALNQYKYQSPVTGYLPYAGQKPHADRDLWVVVTASVLPNAIYAQLINSCIPLPVLYSSFTGERKGEWVQLKWTTRTEQNNKGFYIERLIDGNNWRTVAFIPTQANGGNSADVLNYQYTELNNAGGVSQYRLRQTDIDDRNSYSTIVAIKGYGREQGITVFPNPVRDGQVTMVSEYPLNEYIIRLINMEGRVVKEWVNPAENRLYIGKTITPGLYLFTAKHKKTGNTWQCKLLIAP